MRQPVEITDGAILRVLQNDAFSTSCVMWWVGAPKGSGDKIRAQLQGLERRGLVLSWKPLNNAGQFAWSITDAGRAEIGLAPKNSAPFV